MSVNSFEELRHHVGHKIVCVVYGDNNIKGKVEMNCAIECEDCNTVLIDFDKEEEDE